MKTAKLFLIILSTLILSSACSASNASNADTKVSESFTLKKGESKQAGDFKIKMLSVGHTFGGTKFSVYADLEITEKDKVSKPTLDIGEAISIGDKFLILEAVNETADPKLSDPFAATSCTLVVKTENPKKEPANSSTPPSTPTPAVKLTDSKVKPTLAKVKSAQIKLGFGKKSKVIDLDKTDDVTLGGESNHRYKLFFTSVKDNKIFYLFQVQSGAAISDPMASCGGDSPQTLVLLQTDLDLKVEAANSEVFASCAYNGGRYQQGKTELTVNTLKIIFEQQRKKTEINYDNTIPEKGFELNK